MEVRTWRKQREVYSAQINRVNLQSNGALVNTNAFHNDKSSSLLHYPIVLNLKENLDLLQRFENTPL